MYDRRANGCTARGALWRCTRSCGYGVHGAALLAGDTYVSSGWFDDPGADVWSATVDYGDGSGVQPLALSDHSFTLSHRYTTAGSFTMTVTVSDDDGGSGSATVSVTVMTLQQLLAGMIDMLYDMAAAGSLRMCDANSLSAPLSAAINQLDRGNETAALTLLEAFVNHLNAMVQAGRLSAADAQALLTMVNRVMDAVASI